MWTGKEDSMRVSDVTPFTLGVEVRYGETSVVIPRNTSIPHKCKKPYTTFHDNQTEILFKVYAGEHAMLKDNVRVVMVLQDGS